MQYGRRISFWNQLWNGTQKLSFKYPRLYRLSTLKNGSVRDFCSTEDGQIAWDFHFRRNLLDADISELIHLLEDIKNVTLKEGDAISWNPDRNGTFSISSCYNTLNSIRHVSRNQLGLPLKFIWDNKIPARVCFFLWEINNKV